MLCRRILRRGPRKINWGGNQVRGAANYLTGKSSAEKNSLLLGNISDNSGQANMLNDLAAAIRALAKTIMWYMVNDCVYMLSMGISLYTGFGWKFAIFLLSFCVAKLIVSQSHGPQRRRQDCSPRSGIPLECWQTQGESCAPWYKPGNLFTGECRKRTWRNYVRDILRQHKQTDETPWRCGPWLGFLSVCDLFHWG